MEHQVPVTEKNPSIFDYNDFFIKSIFQINGYIFNGYLIGSESFHAFSLFVGDK